MASFKRESGDWTRYRQLGPHREVDFHYSEYKRRRDIPYWRAMENVWGDAMEALKDAYEEGLSYVIFTHGRSTSRPGQTSARSQVRNLMRSTDATPYIIRNQCIQHESVFVVAVRAKSEGSQQNLRRYDKRPIIKTP